MKKVILSSIQQWVSLLENKIIYLLIVKSSY